MQNEIAGSLVQEGEEIFFLFSMISVSIHHNVLFIYVMSHFFQHGDTHRASADPDRWGWASPKTWQAHIGPTDYQVVPLASHQTSATGSGVGILHFHRPAVPTCDPGSERGCSEPGYEWREACPVQVALPKAPYCFQSRERWPVVAG